MGKILVLIMIFILLCALWSLPLWLCANLVFWVFGLTYRISLLQSFALCLLATTIHKLLFKKED